MRPNIDWLFIVSIFLLLVFGLTVLKSVAPDQVVQQTLIILLALVVSALVALTNYQVLSNFAWPVYILSLALLITTFIIGQTTRGAVRWIPLGVFKLQTSEIAKPLLTVFFAHVISRQNLDKFRHIFAASLLFALPALLIFRQPDLGSTLVVSALWLGIIFAGGIPAKYLAIGLVSLAFLLPLGLKSLKDYQKARLVTFVNPLSDPLESGYNLLQSIIAVGSGKFFGRGLGQGTQSQLNFLPERHTDFIFASLAEELGFVGSTLLIGLFSLLLFRVLKTAQAAKDSFGRLICFGVFSQISFQVFISIGMNIGLVPITGITLPLISAGGSSMISTLLSLSLVLSVSLRHKPDKLFEIH